METIFITTVNNYLYDLFVKLSCDVELVTHYTFVTIFDAKTQL